MKKRRVLSVAETTLRVGAVASGREGRWGGQSCSSCMRLGYGCRMRLCVLVLWEDNGGKKQENSYAHWAEIKSGRCRRGLFTCCASAVRTMDPCSVVAINLWCWLMPSRTSDEIASFNAVLSAAILLLRRLQQAPMVNLEGCRWGLAVRSR